jgi:vacuolar protein sorting-associated protein 13B
MLEGYITPLLMSYIDKYVKNIKPSDLKLSFWGGDAVLRNLELRLDVLEREFGIPLEFKSGCIRELTLHLPWSAIGSSPVEVTIKDLEFVVKLKSVQDESSSTLAAEETAPSGGESAESAPPPPPTVAAGDKEPAPGYLQGYLNRIINNVCIQVQNIVVKVIEEESDLMLTLNIGSVDYYTASDKWVKEFVYTDYFQDEYCLHKMIEVKDVAVNLHPIEMTEKALGGFLHEPFINRCGFACRMKFEYRGKIVERRTLELLVDTVEISVDEKQFCLCLHLVDWLLGMYYATKKLKGRDKNPYLELGLKKAKLSMQSESSSVYVSNSSASTDFADTVNVQQKSGSRSLSGFVTDSEDQAGSAGWGAWLLSFAGPSEGDTHSPGEEASKPKELSVAKSSLIMSARRVTVVLKMTQLVQVPVFTRSFTSPIVKTTFSKCLFRLDRCPVTKLFWVCMGIGAVKADVMGVCPCVKKFPSSWRRTSVATAVDASQVVSLNATSITVWYMCHTSNGHVVHLFEHLYGVADMML